MTAARRRRLPALTDRRKLGRHGLRVSPVCLGAVEKPETVVAAFDAGVNFFFLSADMHWPGYEPMRRGLKLLLERGGGIRDEMVVAVVAYVTQPEFCRIPFLEVLAVLPELERIDVTVAGGAYASEFAARHAVYERHRRDRFAGARSIGASFHERSAARTAIRRGLVDLAFVRYNPGHAKARRDLFPHVPRPRPTLLYNFTSTQGHVTSDRMRELGLDDSLWRPAITDHYRFALSIPAMDGLLCSLDRPAQVSELADALASGPLSPEQQAYLIDLAELSAGRRRLRS